MCGGEGSSAHRRQNLRRIRIAPDDTLIVHDVIWCWDATTASQARGTHSVAILTARVSARRVSRRCHGQIPWQYASRSFAGRERTSHPESAHGTFAVMLLRPCAAAWRANTALLRGCDTVHTRAQWCAPRTRDARLGADVPAMASRDRPLRNRHSNSALGWGFFFFWCTCTVPAHYSYIATVRYRHLYRYLEHVKLDYI